MFCNTKFKGRLVEFFGHKNKVLIGKSREEREDTGIDEGTIETIYEHAMEFKRFYESPPSKL